MQSPSLNRWVRVRLVVGGTGDFDRMLVGLEAGLVPRILSSRSKKTKSDLACPLWLLLSMIFQYVVIKFFTFTRHYMYPRSFVAQIRERALDFIANDLISNISKLSHCLSPQFNTLKITAVRN